MPAFLCYNIYDVGGEDVNRKSIGKRAATVAVAAVLCAALIYVCHGVAGELVRSVVGSENCVIAADYGKITFYGDEYVPLDLGELQYDLGELLVEEAQVEGEGFWDKLFFGEMIYAVKGSAHYELIHLQTEYDFAPSSIYCRKEELVEYEKTVAEFEAVTLYCELINADWTGINKPLDEDTSAILMKKDLPTSEKPLEITREGKNEFIDVKAFGNDGIFYSPYGTFLYRDGEYYWSDAENVTRPLPDSCRAALDGYFSYMFK